MLAIGYRYFMAVAEAGSVRAAARSLNVAASAISRQMLLLESQLGIVLFDRTGRGLGLSPAGEILLSGLRAAAQGHETVLDELAAFKGLKRGLLRIATVESVSVSILPDLLVAFAGSHPGIEVAVTVTGSDAVTAIVRDHQADIGFTFNPASLDGLDVVASRDLTLGAVMAPDHPLARSQKLMLADCLKYPVAWPSEGLSLRTILDSVPAARRMQPTFTCNSLRLMAALAGRGRCITFQTPVGIVPELAEGHLVWVPLADRRLPLDRLHVVRRRGAAARPAVAAFLALAGQHLP